MSLSDEFLQIHDDEVLDTGELELERRSGFSGLRVSIESESSGRRVVTKTSVELTEEQNDMGDPQFISESDVFDAAILPSTQPTGSRVKSDVDDSSTPAAAGKCAAGPPGNGYHEGQQHRGTAANFLTDPISAQLYEGSEPMETAPDGEGGSEGSESEDSSSDSSSQSGESESEAAEAEKSASRTSSSSVSPADQKVSGDKGKKVRVPIVPPGVEKTPPAGSAKRRRSPIRSPMDNPKKAKDSKGQRASPSPRKNGSKSPTEGDQRLKPFLENARFFLIKSGNCENVILSKAKGVWATTPINEKTLNTRFRDTKNVILIFSVEKSGSFQGIARMGSEADRTRSPVSWVLPPGMSPHALGGVFEVQWLCRNELSFDKTYHLKNPYNENKSVKIGRDGTEIEARVGKQLCNMFPADVSLKVEDLLDKVKKFQRSHPVPSSTPNKGKRYSDNRRRPEPPERQVPERRERVERERYRERKDDWGEMRSRPPAVGLTGGNAIEFGGRAYGVVSRDTIMNGSYLDYIHEYSTAGPASYLSYPGYMGGYPSSGPVTAPLFDYPHQYPSSYNSAAPYSLTPPNRGHSGHYESTGRYGPPPSSVLPVLSKSAKYDDRVSEFMDRVGSDRRGDRRSDRDRKPTDRSDRSTRDRPADRSSGREESRHRRHRHSHSPSSRRPYNSSSTAATDVGRISSHRRKSDSRRYPRD